MRGLVGQAVPTGGEEGKEETYMASQMGKGLHAGFFCLKTWVFWEKPGFSIVNQGFLLKTWVFCEKPGFTLENPGLQQKTWVYME